MATVTGSVLLNMPQPDLSAVAKAADLAALQQSADANFKALTESVAKLSTAISTLQAPAPTPVAAAQPAGGQAAAQVQPAQPAQQAAPWPPAANTLTDKFNLALPKGVFQGSAHIDKAGTISGAAIRDTTLDGQRGAGASHRLAYGKGVIHGGAPLTIQDLAIINGGGGDGVSDAEAGAYFEGFDGLVTLLRLAFDNCENGIFVPDIGLAAVDLTLDSCVLGRNGANGLADGRSHDMYVAGRSVTILNSIFAGTSKGNTIKCRGPKLVLRNNFIARRNGRWVDCPGGTDVTSEGNTYLTWPGSNVQNALGFFDEGDAKANPNGAGSFHSKNDTFIFSRAIGEHVWINNAQTDVTFEGAKVFWIGAPGAKPPPIVIDGPGKINGINPFELTADNRIDAPPAMPDDPAVPPTQPAAAAQPPGAASQPAAVAAA